MQQVYFRRPQRKNMCKFVNINLILSISEKTKLFYRFFLESEGQKFCFFMKTSLDLNLWNPLRKLNISIGSLVVKIYTQSLWALTATEHFPTTIRHQAGLFNVHTSSALIFSAPLYCCQNSVFGRNIAISKVSPVFEL